MNNSSSLGSVALNDILSQENNIETQSNHSNTTYTSNTLLTTAATAMHIYQSSVPNSSSYNKSGNGKVSKRPTRARHTKEKIYESEEEIKAAGLSPDVQKREIRKLKNRIAAQKCREQKEVKIAQAEEKVKALESENHKLLTENDLMKRKLQHLEYQVKQHIM